MNNYKYISRNSKDTGNWNGAIKKVKKIFRFSLDEVGFSSEFQKSSMLGRIIFIPSHNSLVITT